MENKVPFVFITDDGYTLPTVVAITSLIENLEECNGIEIKVIYTKLSEESIGYLNQCQCDGVNIELIPFNTDSYQQYQSKSLYVTPTSLIKFEIGNILSNYNKAVYLDGDIIVKGDIGVLRDVNVADYYCAAVIDLESSVLSLSHKRLGLDFYFNSGVMVLNLEKIRNEKLSQSMFYIKQNRKDLYYMDQDVLNLAFCGNVLKLPIKYNFIIYTFWNKDENLKILSDCYDVSYESYNDIKSDSCIIHMAGAEKPWKSSSSICFDDWMHYFALSPMKNVSLFLDNNVKKSQPLIYKLFKRKPRINKNGKYQVDMLLCGITILSKVRESGNFSYYIMGVKVKEFSF